MSNLFLEVRDATNHFVFSGVNKKTLWHPCRDIAKEKSRGSRSADGIKPDILSTLHVGA